MTQKNTPLIGNVSFIQYKLFDFGFDNHYKNSLSIKNKLPVHKKLVIVDENTYAYEIPFCKHCYSRDVVENSVNTRSLFDKDGNNVVVTVQRYKCNDCNKSSQVEFEGEYEQYCRYPVKIKEKSEQIMGLDAVSLRNAAEFHEIFNGFSISHETVRKLVKVPNYLYFINNDLVLSGYYGYDEQWAKIDGKWQFRYVLFDLINKIPVAEGLYPKITKKYIKEFIEKSIPLYNRKGIVTDLNTDYDSVLEDLGFDNHQKCIFHLDLRIREKIREYLAKVMKKLSKEIKKENKKLSKKEIKAIAEERIKPIKDELFEYKRWFFQLFDFKKYSDALKFIEEIKNKISEFPQVLKDYLSSNFMPEYKKYLTFLKFPNKDRLDRTNNQTENYIGNIMPKADKKKYRTEIGFMSQIYHRMKNWIQNRTSSLTS